jgi:nitrogen regulatory protein P-II 1
MVVKASRVEELTDAIANSLRTGTVGDGKIFVYPIAKAIRIRTGEEDEKVV